MKKNILIMMLGVLAFVSCTKDDTTGAGETGGTVNATIIANVPLTDYQTRTGEGNSITRCIMEIYAGGVLYERDSANVSSLSATFNVRLATGLNYDFVFWADAGNGIYNVADLRAISFDPGAYQSNDETRDAFFAHINKPSLSATDVNFNVILKRPFGQMNVTATDMTRARAAVIGLEKVNVVFATGLYTGFNALDGSLSTPASVEYTVNLGSSFDWSGTMTVDYIFAPPTDQQLIDFTMNFCRGDNSIIVSNGNFINVPIKRNYRTNVSGNLITKAGTINVTVNPVFEGVITTQAGETTYAGLVDFFNNFDSSKFPSATAFEFTVTDQNNGTDNIVIPSDMTAPNFPSITIHFAAGLMAASTLSITEAATPQYSGKIIVDAGNSPAASVVIDTPEASVEFSGTVGNLTISSADNTLVINRGATIGNLTVNKGNVEIYGAVTGNIVVNNSSSKISWAAYDAETLTSIVADTRPNDAVFLCANISNLQKGLRILKTGYLFDGRGFRISGGIISTNAGPNVIAISADNVTVKNVTLTNTLGSGMTVYKANNVTIDSVKFINNQQGGIIINGSTVSASNITSSGNGWYFADLDRGTGVTSTPGLAMSGTNDISDAIAIYSEGGYQQGHEAANWVTGDNWIPIQEIFTITNLVAAGDYRGNYNYVWGQNNGHNAFSDTGWGINRFLTQAWSLSADFVQTMIIPLPQPWATSDKFREWQGVSYNPGNANSNSWSAETQLYLVDGLVNTLQSFWIVTGDGTDIIDYVALMYASSDMPGAYGGPYTAGWNWYNSATNAFNPVSNPSITTSSGPHKLKIARSGITTSMYIDDQLVNQYDDTDTGSTQSNPMNLLFNAKTYTNQLTTQWAYPQIH